MTFVVAIDGPGGVGKTSVSRGVANSLGFAHLDTGAYYRAATVVALVNRARLASESEVLAAVAGAELHYDGTSMTIEGIEMNDAIRSAAVTAGVSQVSAYPSVRRLLVAKQRAWVARAGGRVVVEGRDIGTVVFADAPVKVYLTARPEIRAGRRAGETPTADVDTILEDLAIRDSKDSTREASPLAAAEDAVVIDTSDISRGDVIAAVIELVEQRSPGT